MNTNDPLLDLLDDMGRLLDQLDRLRAVRKHLKRMEQHPNYPYWLRSINRAIVRVNDEVNQKMGRLDLGVYS